MQHHAKRKMNKDDIIQLLESHSIKATANRILVAQTLGNADRPLSLKELEYMILTIDKSGVFRALTEFKRHSLVHVIEDGSKGVRYELCHSQHHDDDDDMHVHFFCERCQRTFCLHEALCPNVSLPDGFTITGVNFVVKGICSYCNSHKRHDNHTR